MKRCPTCDKTFADGMRFCQTDGTVLIDDAPAVDPYKTVVGSQSDIASAMPPLDPFKTMVAPLPKADEDILQLPEEPDLLKTMVVSQDELREELKANEEVPPLDIPPPFAPSAPLIEPKPASPKEFSPMPKFNEPAALSPVFGDESSPAADSPKPFEVGSGDPPETAASPFDSKPSPNDFSTRSPYGKQENKPIPSPFDGSMVGYLPPSAPPFDAPKPPVKQVEPPFGSYQEPAENQSPFQPPSPFGNAEPFNQPMQQTEWTPPPAPMSQWQNQELGANTPFQPPGAASGQDQTLAIVSLVSGIIGILCCQIAAPVAIITGYMAKKKADENPAQFGGSGLALAGMITGGIGMLVLILVVIYYILVIAAVAVN